MLLARLRVTRELVARAAGPVAVGAMLVLLLVVGPAAEVAWAEEEARPGWTVALDAGFEVFEYDINSSVTSAVAPRQSGAQTKKNDNSDFKFGIEVMTPALASWLGRPRLFAGVGGQVPLGSEDVVFQIGGGLSAELPEQEIASFEQDLATAIGNGCLTSPPCPTADPASFGGQGSRIGVDFRPLWYLSLGAALNLELPDDFLFRLKPSLEYVGGRLGIDSALTTVLEPAPEEFTVVRSSAGTMVTDHRLGPGIEGELVISRTARPVALSIYVDARFLWMVSDGSTSFADPAGIAQYSVDRGNALSFGGGVRLTWMGLAR